MATIKITLANRKAWWRKELHRNGEVYAVELYDLDFNYIGTFDSVDELMYFVRGIVQ